MTDLVCMLSTGKGTWAEVTKLIRTEKWDKVYLVTNEFGKEKFTTNCKHEFIVVQTNGPEELIKKQVIEKLNGKLKGDVAINFSSGTGKEHMAFLSALMSLGCGMRFVIAGEQGAKEV